MSAELTLGDWRTIGRKIAWLCALMMALPWVAAAQVNFVTIVAEDAAASEVGSNGGLFAITRTGGSNAIFVSFTISGTASSGVDYTAFSSGVSLGAGVNRATIPVSVRADSISEPTETVVLSLIAKSSYQLGSQKQATVQISDGVAGPAPTPTPAPTPPPSTGTWYVSTNGSDTAAGTTAATAFRTIQRAANVVQPGNTVVVLPGVYSESVQLSRAGTAAQPITFRADGIARGRVTISGARRDVRDNSMAWRLETTLGVSGAYSIPLDYTPIRVLADDVDLFAYQTLEDFKQLWVSNVNKSGKPGPGPRQGWVVNGGRLYVRLHASGQYGSVDPSKHVMKIGPRIGGGTFGHLVEKPSDYNFGVLTSGASHVVLDGFTFETPGISGVYAPMSHVTVRNCWSIGCRALVLGSAGEDYNDACSDVVVEYCEHTEHGTLQDIRDVVDAAQALSPETFATINGLYWWHRKGGPLTYEYGIVACAGARWKVRNCFVHDTFDGLSWRAVSWSRDMEVYSNVFADLVDNAVETEDHSQGMRVYNNYIRDVWSPLSYQPNALDRLPNDAEFRHNVFFMSPRHAAFWERLFARQIASIFKMYTPGLVSVNLTGNGVRYHHNTFWHPCGAVFNTANLGDFMSGFAFEDNIVVARTLDLRRPDPPMPNYQCARNFVAPSHSSLQGPGARFAGPGGMTYADPSAIGLRDPANGDMTLVAGSRAATGDGNGQAVGAVAAGQQWTPPAAGPRLSALAALGPSGSAPVAVSDNGHAARGGWTKIYVLANDHDANRDLLTVLSAGQGNFGKTEIEGQQVIYIPGTNFTTGDEFTYTIGDGRGNTATAQVTIARHNAIPVAVADSVLAQPGTAVTIGAAANDTDADNDSLAIASFTQGGRGSVSLVGGSLRYAPFNSAPGSDSFDYTVSDGRGGTASSTVTLVALPAPPVAVADSYTIQTSEWPLLEVLQNDHDGNGRVTTLLLVDATHGSKGKVEIRGPWPTMPAHIRYTPYANASGPDSFTYTVSHLGGQRATATVTLNLIRNERPVANRDYYYASRGVPITLNVLANDSDPDGDPLTLVSFTAPSIGTASITGNALRYTASSVGWDSFYYNVSDGRGGMGSGQVAIYVNP